ncbi:YfhO family protein [Salimicrobium flavidum]|uniref:Uncharacterized membrane protein YfhO n=1 Tax=Salimicrobium flavidum TaxID=570947 RepID=A0A1N7J978_9BACI|nr:YfhO family protein [Salimicrobium flavidum]SIS45811.1 Uncharacterized membrane protein YfhO [Salimicrobium flavidum]
MTKKQIMLLLSFSLLTAILAHAFFLYQWNEGQYLVGPDDGLSQMIPFKEMLYDQFTDGEFFYSYEFGLGGGTYSQLAYYFSLNIFFFFTVAVVFMLETFAVIGEPDVLFWAQSTVFFSITRMFLVLIITTLVFRYLTGRLVPSFTGAVFYATAAKYFHHVTYWEFFGDAFLWLPLLVLGVEKIIRENKPGWLIVATALSFFDNFYFAYINGFFTGMYILLRWFIPISTMETTKMKQMKVYVPAVGLGFGIGTIGFIPAVWGFLQNVRPPYNQEIALVEGTTNILYDSIYLIVPALFLLMLLLRPLYQNRGFRFFAIISLILIGLHFIPYAASFFNGFSAPQHRYEYLASFTIGGAIATGLPLLKSLKLRDVRRAGIGMGILYILFLLGDTSLQIMSPWSILVLIGTAVTYLFLGSSPLNARRGILPLVIVAITVQLVIMNTYQWDKLFRGGEVHESSKEYILSSDYIGTEQQQLIQKATASSPLARVSWMADGRYNTPIIQGFQGTSAYSSILNGNLLNYYYHDLEIDMKRESVSRYSGFGDRANLHSLWLGNYVMYEKGEEDNAPYGFERMMDSENFVIYENTNPLPYVQISDKIYSEESLENSHPISREDAMLKGLIVKGATTTSSDLPSHRNLADEVSVESIGGSYAEGQLDITADEGGIDLILPEETMASDAEDIYVSFYLLHNDKEAPLFSLEVNDFYTTRKSRDSIYKTGVNDITIRVPKEKVISIRMREGSYTLEEIGVFAEDYQTLEEASQNAGNRGDVTRNGNRITIDSLEVQSDGYLAIPVPFEKGWSVKVDGEQRETAEVNYSMLGTSIESGDKKVEFTYHPPYFRSTLLVTSFSILLSIVWIVRRGRKSP